MTRHLSQFLRYCGTTDPAQITEAMCSEWVRSPRADGEAPANNTVRNRMSVVREFLRYCSRQGIAVCDPSYGFDKLRKSYPRTAGKVQGQYPGRCLSHEEAFQRLIDACKDGTWKGSRDQLIIRLGLLGIRRAEISRLTIGNLAGQELRWMGKGNRPRCVQVGPTLATLLGRWTDVYARQLGRPLRASDPLLCPTRSGPQRTKSPQAILWGKPLSYDRVALAVNYRARKAALGYVAPHDLRRTAAAIMHADTTDDGGHRFDIYDIQQVLGHANITTTQIYLANLVSTASRRAAQLLD